MKYAGILLVALTTTTAFAQQPPRQVDIQAFRDQLGDAYTALALCNGDAKSAAQNDQRIIADLQKQIADLKTAPKK